MWDVLRRQREIQRREAEEQPDAELESSPENDFPAALMRRCAVEVVETNRLEIPAQGLVVALGRWSSDVLIVRPLRDKGNALSMSPSFLSDFFLSSCIFRVVCCMVLCVFFHMDGFRCSSWCFVMAGY